MPLRRIDPKEIIVQKRFRKDAGDIDGLAGSIKSVGLLHPIVVDSTYRLVAGSRRLRAVKELKWDTIPVNVVSNLDEASLSLQAECDENTCRKVLLPSEAVSLGIALERLERPKAKERQKDGGRLRRAKKVEIGSGKKPEANGRDTRDKVGASLGMSGRTYEKAKAVVASGNSEAIEQMDRTGKVGPAHNSIKQKEKEKALKQKAKESEHLIQQPEWTLICGDSVKILKSLDEQSYARLVFADPPYNIGVNYGSGKQADLLSGTDYLNFSSAWMEGCWDNLADDGSFWLLISDEYAAELCLEAKKLGFHLRSWIKWFEGFGVNCANNFNRTTRHIFWFVIDPKRFVFNSHEVMRPSDRQTKYSDKRASSGGKIENDLWDIPRLAGTCAERMPGFPTQVPVALIDRIVRCASEPGDLILDPFSGSGTSGIAALQNGRKYIGIDQSEKFIDLSSARLKAT